MKNLLIILLILFTASCKKGELKIADIIQTDEVGNIIGNSSTDQWLPKTFTYSFDNDILIKEWNFYIENIFNGDTSLKPKYDCPLPTALEIIAFPNPVSNIEDLRIKLRSSKPICLYTFGFAGLVENSGGGSATGEFYQNNVSECKTEFVIKPAGQANFPTDDMEISFLVVTADGCVYSAKGNVLVE